MEDIACSEKYFKKICFTLDIKGAGKEMSVIIESPQKVGKIRYEKTGSKPESGFKIRNSQLVLL